MSEYKLTQAILDLSQSAAWETAKKEWVLDQIYEADQPETCLCGHFPIVEVCVLRNKLNANFANVGNCCVKKFIGLPSDLIFQAVKRIRIDSEKSLNEEAINHAFEKGWITKWEFEFSIDTMRKRKLTPKQLQSRIKINATMLRNMKRGTGAAGA